MTSDPELREILLRIMTENPGIEENDLIARADAELFKRAIAESVRVGEVRVSVSADAEFPLRAASARLSAARVPSERARLWEAMLRLDPGMETFRFSYVSQETHRRA